MNKQQWILSLKEFILAQRQAKPIPQRESLTDEEEWHCRIIGGEFMGWYQRQLQGILDQRTALRVGKFEPDPHIVLTTSIPGLVAMQEILPDPTYDFSYLRHDEFLKWKNANLADAFKFHLRHWSFFHPLDKEYIETAKAAYPDVKLEQFRIHTCGDLWAEQAGVDSDNLWQWDGKELILLEESFSESIF